MSFPTYRNYKPSGELWLGQVPAHWTLHRLGFYFIERRQKVSDKVFKPLSVSKAGIVPQIETAAKTDDGDNRKRVNRGDFVINSRSDRRGSAGVSELEGSVSLINTVLIPQEPVCMRFIHHLFRSVPFQEEYYRHGKGIVADLWSTNFSEMKNICLSMPPSSEQEQIASFLDQETSKIDALISEQQRLIELLKEKRQAVISHAVTKGLNPDVRMKPSGVEWLGEVPEHWSLIPLKHCVKMSTEKAEESSFPVALENVQSWTGTFIPGEGDFSGEGVAFQAGDILFGKLRPYLAKAFLADKAGEAVGDFHVLRPHAGVFGRWLQYRILTREFIAEMNSASFGSKMPRVSWEFMGRMPIPLPPMAEQRAVAHKLNSELAVIDELVVDADKATALLQERRTALISAAVTGKIDVRNYAATQKDAA